MNRKTRRAEKFTRGGEKPANVTGRQVFGGFVPFADPSAQTSDGWTVLAYEVAMAGSDVALTRRDFEDCVRNFSAYPCSPVTIEHADTDANPFAPPPREWREPNGHIEALRVGSMVRAGKTVATLEGKPSYLEPTATDVKNKKWRYGSITIIQNAVSEETAQEIGSMLWSWSLTAHPRLTGLPAIAASQKMPDGAVVRAGYWWGDIDTREDLIACLREIFDLPVTSTETEILAELDKLEGLAGGEGDTSGIDVDHIVGQLRDALRLPALKTKTEVIAEVRKGLTTLPSEVTPATDTSMSHRGAAARNTEKIMFKFLPFAALLGLVAATEEDAEKKVTTFAQLGADAIKALGLPVTCTAAELAARVKELTDAAGKLPAMESEIAIFRAEKAAAEKTLRAAWIEDVIAARPELAPVKASLTLHAETDWKGFAEAYPRPDRAKLVEAAAEAAQRAQDGARTQPVTVTATANPKTKDAPALPAPATNLRAEISKVLEEFGYPTDAKTITDAIGKGHTPASLRAALQAA